MKLSHGPTLVDNNILLSDYSMKLATQGVAVVHNLTQVPLPQLVEARTTVLARFLLPDILRTMYLIGPK